MTLRPSPKIADGAAAVSPSRHKSSAERRLPCANGIRAWSLGGGLGTRRFFVLRDPRQRGFHVGELAGGKPFDPDAGRLRLFLGEFGARDRVDPYQTTADFGREFLLLFFGHTRLLKDVWTSIGHDTRLGACLTNAGRREAAGNRAVQSLTVGVEGTRDHSNILIRFLPAALFDRLANTGQRLHAISCIEPRRIYHMLVPLPAR